MKNFSDFGLHSDLLRGIADLGFTEPTPIQTDAIPPAMTGRDLLACAMTGSGKTAAFLLPILQQLLDRPARKKSRVLILSPTRELAAQTAEHLEALGRHTPIKGAAIFGGVAMGPQERAFRQGVDILVATPGRLLDHLQNPYASLGDIEILVLDEADRMLDMGFLPDIKRVLAQLPAQRQNLLFSATMPAPIAALSREILKNPVSLHVERKAAPATGISQAVYPVAEDLKPTLLVELLRRGDIKNVLVFTRTKHRANRLAEWLERHGVSCDRIHGNRSQSQRTDALARFKNGGLQVLVATDIAARGIDVEALSHVINFDVPNVPEDYIHRVGRTARAGEVGDAFTFCAPQEQADLNAIERAVGHRLERRTVPGFDYQSKPAERFEVPIGERIAAIRARKAEERARAKAKAERKAQREAEQNGRPAERRASAPPARHSAPRPANAAAGQRPAGGAPAHRPAGARKGGGQHQPVGVMQQATHRKPAGVPQSPEARAEVVRAFTPSALRNRGNRQGR